MMGTEHSWEPLAVRDAARVFDTLGIPWWVAGGQALDLFAGRPTRSHGDLDLAILRRDAHHLRLLADEWDAHVPHDGQLTPWDGRPLTEAEFQFWVRRQGANAWAFEVLLERNDGDEWVFRRDPRIRRPLSTIGHRSEEGVPFLAPEICVLYKARHPDLERHAIDFEMAVPLLTPEARHWLAEALGTVEPEHPWLKHLLQP